VPMLRPTKKTLARVGAAAVIVAAFASAAMAADTSGTVGSDASSAAAVSKVSLPAAAGAVATAVLDAIAGGSSPSSVAGEKANGQANKGGDEESSLISAAQRILVAGTAGTVGVRPGWGCGDKNHTHSGPPGRPDATPPPGCDR